MVQFVPPLNSISIIAIQPSAEILKPVIVEVNKIDHITTVQCSAGTPLVLI